MPRMSESIEEEPWITGVRTRIFLVSFTLLFFELLCIRWIPAYVRYLSYFTNFILLASFLGMGLGILAARRANSRSNPAGVMTRRYRAGSLAGFATVCGTSRGANTRSPR